MLLKLLNPRRSHYAPIQTLGSLERFNASAMTEQQVYHIKYGATRVLVKVSSLESWVSNLKLMGSAANPWGLGIS